MQILKFAKHKLNSLIRMNNLFMNRPNIFAVEDLTNSISTYEKDLKNS